MEFFHLFEYQFGIFNDNNIKIKLVWNISKYRKLDGLKTIFVSGTAGSGKSLLTSKLQDYYSRNGAFAAILKFRSRGR